MPKLKRQSQQQRADKNKLHKQTLRADTSGSSDINSQRTVIAATHHQGDQRYHNRGIQCTFISFYAIIENMKHSSRTWKGADLDEILQNGDKLFMEHFPKKQNTCIDWMQ